MSPRPFPMHDHPLTKLYIAGAEARNHAQMLAAYDMSKIIEQSVSDQVIAACKLAADVLMERKNAIPSRFSERVPLSDLA